MNFSEIKKIMSKATRIGAITEIQDNVTTKMSNDQEAHFIMCRAAEAIAPEVTKLMARHTTFTWEKSNPIHNPHLNTQHRFEAYLIHPDDWKELTDGIRTLEKISNFTDKIV